MNSWNNKFGRNIKPFLNKIVIIVGVLLLLTIASVYGLAKRFVAPTPDFQSSDSMTTDSGVPSRIGTSIGSANPSTPLKISFVMANAPKLNEPVIVKVTVSSLSDAPDTSAQLEIPASAVLVSGTTKFRGDLGKNETAEFEAVIKFTKVGNTTIRAITNKVVNQDMAWGDATYIYLNIGRDSSHFGFEYSPSSGGQMP